MASGRPAPPTPRSVAYSGRNAKNPAMPQVPVMIRKPGRMPAGWKSASAGGRSPVARCRMAPGAVSGTSSVRTVADRRHRGGREPDRLEPARAEDRLPDERPDRQPEVERQ